MRINWDFTHMINFIVETPAHIEDARAVRVRAGGSVGRRARGGGVLRRNVKLGL